MAESSRKNIYIATNTVTLTRDTGILFDSKRVACYRPGRVRGSPKYGGTPTAVFTATGQLGPSASVTSGFKPALAARGALALLATLSATAITSRAHEPVPSPPRPSYR